MDAELLAVVEVDRPQRVTCQAPGCGHAVYKRIHVVRHDGLVKVYGSDCFDRLFSNMSKAAGPRYGGAAGRLLSADERQMLVLNTDQLVAQFEAEDKQVQERLRRSLQATSPSPQLVRPARRFVTGPTLARTDQPPSPTPAELVGVEAQAKEMVRARYGVDPDAAGWRGLVMACQRELLAK